MHEEDELEQLEREIGMPSDDASTSEMPLRSQYSQTKQELAAALANRFVHSRTYIFLYLGMAALSLTTVVLSLLEGCPGIAFFVLEMIINSGMIIEVGIRLVAFGRKFWKSPFNYLDIFVTLFCIVTLITVSVSGCSGTSKSEELLDTLLLVARNVLQFTRLANVLRKSGRSIFARPAPIDLSQARRLGYALDIDLFDEDAQLAEEDPHAAAPLVPQGQSRREGQNGGVVFDAARESTVTAEGQDRMGRPDRGKVFGTDDAEEQWAHL
ncbi:hypothetical protein DACRYDRAFT_81726 [Dacryopinax primogenitus]|uniref:Ion transport domain-containing protein n=1 Tax=Dacryopinax primogenitus (strain DJM 731) TaxID=1858805 RepID=M5FUX6_DACPD|nr:uncharacterized protein DACRYDRAFT_81726 [Dacryopinax primogenitus]EJU00059.1 hypothetical protein DACRYDRAFT_81726 [Dacryopinax primogenitus]